MAAGKDPVGNPRRMSYIDKLVFIQNNQNKRGSNRTWSPEQQAAQDNALDALGAPFDILAWIRDNWQAAIIIVVSLVILTR